MGLLPKSSPCDDCLTWSLGSRCENCREGDVRVVLAADRARIAAAFDEEFRQWPAEGDAYEALTRLLRVVEGG